MASLDWRMKFITLGNRYQDGHPVCPSIQSNQRAINLLIFLVHDGRIWRQLDRLCQGCAHH